MKLLERRALTLGEIALARPIFAAEIQWKRVRVVQLAPLGFAAMAPFRHSILFGSWRAARDFSLTGPDEQGWFVHELAHVWQAARGVVLPLAKLKALGDKAYKYAPHKDARFSDYNIESQAEIVRHLFLRERDCACDGPDREWLKKVWGSRNA